MGVVCFGSFAVVGASSDLSPESTWIGGAVGSAVVAGAGLAFNATHESHWTVTPGASR